MTSWLYCIRKLNHSEVECSKTTLYFTVHYTTTLDGFLILYKFFFDFLEIIDSYFYVLAPNNFLPKQYHTGECLLDNHDQQNLLAKI